MPMDIILLATVLINMQVLIAPKKFQGNKYTICIQHPIMGLLLIANFCFIVTGRRGCKIIRILDLFWRRKLYWQNKSAVITCHEDMKVVAVSVSVLSIILYNNYMSNKLYITVTQKLYEHPSLNIIGQLFRLKLH